MISQFIAAAVVATTAFSPSSEPIDQSVNKTFPLVRQDISPWFTERVDFTCPDTHPYVHEVGWGWTNAPHDDIGFWNVGYGNTAGAPATRIAGFMTNWHTRDTRWVEANVLCTSDVNQARKVPSFFE